MKELMETWRRKVLDVEDDEYRKFNDVEAEEADVDDEEEEIEEWKLEDDYDYPSRKKARRKKRMLKPDRTSWAAGADALATGGLTKGIVEKKPRKPQCHAYNPSHNDEGQFTDPDKEKGSSSMAKPDPQSPDDCAWGQNRRMKPNRSTQATKRPCGRKGKYRCKDGTEKWEEGLEQQDAAYLRGIISQELEAAIKKHMSATGCSFNQLIHAMTAWTAAEKGGGKS